MKNVSKYIFLPCLLVCDLNSIENVMNLTSVFYDLLQVQPLSVNSNNMFVDVGKYIQRIK